MYYVYQFYSIFYLAEVILALCDLVPGGPGEAHPHVVLRRHPLGQLKLNILC